jgi:hypothetical protein
MQASKKDELARFNMPFELGMDIGCKRFGRDNHKSKCLLILDNEFNGDFYEIAQSDELSEEDVEEMPWDEFRFYIIRWKEGRENFE